MSHTLPPAPPQLPAHVEHGQKQQAHGQHGQPDQKNDQKNEKKKNASHEHDSGELEFELPAAARPSGTRVMLIGVGALVVVGAAFVIGYLPRHKAKTDLVAESKEAAQGNVKVQLVEPKGKASDRAMTLPASVQPLEEAIIYPRSNGYVRTWKADIGDTVKEGQLLAEIDTPEIDQQLAQARAQLAQSEAALIQAKANKGYSATNLTRLNTLAPKGVASLQELEKAQAQSVVDDSSVEVAQANVEAQKASLGRIQQLVGFSRVTAPFDGTINMRNIERGTLVSGTTQMFRLSQTDTVRVFIQMPQDVAPSVTVGAAAQVQVREFPGRMFDGHVSRTAASLDAVSRTMTTEIRVPNPKHELLGGMFAQILLSLPSPHRVWEIPATAVITDANGIRIAAVQDGKIVMKKVTIERDNGATMDISSGIVDGDKVVKLATADLYDGRPIDVVPNATPDGKQEKGTPPSEKKK